MTHLRCLLPILVCLVVGVAWAEEPEWRAWRGPQAAGSVESGSYPVKFGAEKYLWRTKLPGKGCSTPILLAGRIYLTAPARGK
jgi:outer membrane protein assembly factor BamB